MQVVALAALAGLAASPACASPVILDDNYIGGTDTYDTPPADVIGDPTVFQITDAVIERIDGGDVLQITIDTNFAGAPGTSGADGTGYGVLFITPSDEWNPTGTAPYPTDQDAGDDWMYAATIPEYPGSGSASGNGALYLTSDGTIVNSNVDGCGGQTYPINGSCGYYFRAGQPVQFTPGDGQTSLYGETWAVDASTGTITFDITDDGALGNDFAISWAMTCANDIIQGQVALDPVPEPPTWSLLLAGLVFAGAMGLRRSRRAPKEI